MFIYLRLVSFQLATNPLISSTFYPKIRQMGGLVADTIDLLPIRQVLQIRLKGGSLSVRMSGWKICLSLTKGAHFAPEWVAQFGPE